MSPPGGTRQGPSPRSADAGTDRSRVPRASGVASAEHEDAPEEELGTGELGGPS